MTTVRQYRAGDPIEDVCRSCKVDRMHTVVAADTAGAPIRVRCDYCDSEHNYRGGPARVPDSPGAPSAQRSPATPAALPIVSDHERTAPAVTLPEVTQDLELLLRRIIREEAGITPAAPAARWRGGTLVLRPGTPGLQEKAWPIETFFQKIVMIRNRLRTLEQQVNASELPTDTKMKLQAYITGCYGSLTSFNLLFAEEGDQFKGSGGD